MSGGNTTHGGVRFSDVNQEIEPVGSLHQVDTIVEEKEKRSIPHDMESEIRNLAITLQTSRLQGRRMGDFAFEPVSLPASRAPSPARSHNTSRNTSRNASRNASPSRSHSGSKRGSLSMASGLPAGQSSPLTPAATKSRDGKLGTPHASGTHLAKGNEPEALAMTPQRSPPSDEPRRRSTPRSSVPPSREPSPHGSGTASPFGSSTFKVPQYKQNSEGIDPRSIYIKDYKGDPSYPSSSTASSTEKNDKSVPEIKHHGLFGSKRVHADDDGKHSGGSMSDLKRFFKIGGTKKDKLKGSESSSRKSSKLGTASGFRTPPLQSRQSSMSSVPFADDHGLQSKYGKLGKMLGSGAGGSVRLMKRSSDGVTFAVKQFRARHAYETEKEYNKKVTAEFCIGSTLHHGNVIETMDIVHEKGNWYEVMEYAPFDLFATVMTGKMSKEEVTCCTMQIISGVAYLHSMGLAHRDLKLDNVVVSEHGIMKLIDFGSAVVYRYPFETEVVRASGIVGSDPYLAPEVYENSKYDPRAVDVWSLAIIYCCMILRRFPWKAPRLTDVSYKLFVSTPSPGTPSMEHSRKPSSDGSSGDMSRDESMTAPDIRPGQQRPKDATGSSATGEGNKEQSAVIRGPWRLLRLLPRETRFIIGRMLEVDPAKRATLDEVLVDKWVSTSAFCKQEDLGRIERAPGHIHTLEPGAPVGEKK